MRSWIKTLLWVGLGLVLLFVVRLVVDTLVPDSPASNFVYDGF